MQIDAADGPDVDSLPCPASRSASDRGRVVAVFSPCGGIGTTTTAINLAAHLAAGPQGGVALVELRPAPGEFAAILRVRPLYTLDDVCRHWDRLDQCILRSAMVRHAAGFDILCQRGYPVAGGLPHVRLCSPIVRGLVGRLRTSHAFSVIELDRTLAARQMEAMRAADIVLMLVRPDAPSIRRACWAMKTAKAFHVPRERFALVLARSGRRDQFAPAVIERVFRLPVAAQLPEAPQAVGHAVGEGRGLIEGPGSSRFAACLKRLAQSLQASSQSP